MKQKTEQLLKDDRVTEMCPQHIQGSGTEEKIEIINTLVADTDYSKNNLESKTTGQILKFILPRCRALVGGRNFQLFSALLLMIKYMNYLLK